MQTATLSVGENCDTELAVKYSDQLTRNKCAARVTHVLADK